VRQEYVNISELLSHEKAPEEIQKFLKRREEGVYISPLF
jgi:hypothetical protein